MKEGFHRLGMVAASLILALGALALIPTTYNYLYGTDRNEVFAVLPIAAVCAALAYGACRTVAWVLAGFMKP